MNSTSRKAVAAVVGLTSIGALSSLAFDAPAHSASPAPAITAGAPSGATDLGLVRDAAAGQRASRSRAIAGKAESLRLRAEAAHRAALQKAALARRAEQVRAAARRAEQAKATRLRAAAEAAPTPIRTSTSSSSSFSDTELRIRSCESGPNGSATNGRADDYDYSAQNPSSTASGAWQFLDSTWNGYGGYTHASSAPRSVQDAKARSYIDANGYSAWEASRSCWSA